MFDFEKVAEISFVVGELNQMIVTSNNIIVTPDNLAEFIRNSFDT